MDSVVPVQTPTTIDDVDGFVQRVLAVQDPLRINDDLEDLKYVAFSVLANRMVKFSGLFATRELAIERAQKVSMDGAFTTAVHEVGKWGLFGRGMGKTSVKDAVRDFAKGANMLTNAFKERIETAQQQDDDKEPAQKEPEQPDPAAKPAAKPAPQKEPDPSLVRRMRLAMSRGDVKEDRMLEQRHIVVAHGRISEESCLFRVVGSYETEEEAARAAKKAFDADDTDVVTKRFDYAVARQFVWHNFPINFTKDVEDTKVESNPHLEQYYKGEVHRRSDEYKAAMADVEATTREMRKQAAEREKAEAAAAEEAEIKSDSTGHLEDHVD